MPLAGARRRWAHRTSSTTLETHLEKTTTMERNDSHLYLNLSDHNSPEDVIDVLFLEAFISGSLRHARKANLPG